MKTDAIFKARVEIASISSYNFARPSFLMVMRKAEVLGFKRGWRAAQSKMWRQRIGSRWRFKSWVTSSEVNRGGRRERTLWRRAGSGGGRGAGRRGLVLRRLGLQILEEMARGRRSKGSKVFLKRTTRFIIDFASRSPQDRDI